MIISLKKPPAYYWVVGTKIRDSQWNHVKEGRIIVYCSEIVGQALVITLEGEFDLHTAPPFKEHIDTQLHGKPEIINLIFIMSKLTFIDSSGLGVILGRYRIIQERGGQLIFAAPSPQVKRILELSGMQKISKFSNSAREALELI